MCRHLLWIVIAHFARMSYSFTYAASGHSTNTIIQNGGQLCYAKIPQDHWLLAAVDVPSSPHPTDGDAVNVPLWFLAGLVQHAYSYEGDGDAFAADSILHMESIAFTLDAFYDAGYAQSQDGEYKTWATPLALANYIGDVARRERALGVHVSPYVIYDEDIVDSQANLYPASFAYLNNLTMGDFETTTCSPWLRMHILFHPVTPSLILTDDDSDQAVMAKLLLASARQAFPALCEGARRRGKTRTHLIAPCARIGKHTGQESWHTRSERPRPASRCPIRPFAYINA